MSLSTSRAMFKPARFRLSRQSLRPSSTTSQAAEAASQSGSKAKAAASNAVSKASEGLSKVTSAAGPALSGAAKGAGEALGKATGRTGRLIKFVRSIIPPTIYYSRVGIELSKLVFHGQKMSPPPLSTFQSYIQPLLHAARHPSSLSSSITKTANSINPAQVLQQIRNVDRQQLVTTGVVAAEVVGFFTIGEIIGRLKIVGYRGDNGGHH